MKFLSSSSSLYASFSSDEYAEGTGFVAIYRTLNASAICNTASDCSSHGVCSLGKCICDSFYSGVRCQDRLAGYSPYTPREYHAVSYDSRLDMASVLYGKDASTIKSDFFLYNFTSQLWTAVPAASTLPSPRYAHRTWWFQSRLILFGGIDLKQGYTDVWSWNMSLNQWTLLGTSCTSRSNSNCPVVFEPAVVFVPVSQSDFVIYVFGGVNYYTGMSSSKLYKFASASGEWSYISNGPVSYQGGQGVFHANSNSLRFFGGFPNQDPYFSSGISTTFEYSIDAGVWGHAASYDNSIYYEGRAVYAENEIAIFHGGQNIGSFDTCFSGKVKVLDLACNYWTTLQTTPAINRQGHGLFLRNQSLWVMGGTDGVLHNDLVEIPLALTLKSEQERNACRAATYCASLTRCASCQRKTMCSWCNSACSYNADEYPLGNLTSLVPPQQLPQGSLVNGICPSNYTVAAVCPTEISLIPGQALASSLAYQTYQDYFLWWPQTMGVYTISVKVEEVPRQCNATLRTTFVDAAPYSPTTLENSLSITISDPYLSYTRVRVSWDNNVGLASSQNLPTPMYDAALAGKTCNFSILLSSSYSAPNSSVFSFSDIAVLSFAVFAVCTIAFGIRRWLQRYQPIRQTPSVPIVYNLRQIPKRYSYVAGIGEKIDAATVPLSFERFTAERYPNTISATSFLVLLPGAEGHLSGGLLPPFQIGTAIYAETAPDSNSSATGSRRTKGRDYIPLQFIQKSRMFGK
ncbi:Multiple epidermal growth factor-like domains protein 8 [Kappamyces sp. JEL0829]|nr:Multiple epidermal growth factor-like domains protein 8 [Kappamyces sp. JEL0829]